MTVSTTSIQSGPYTGNGVTTQFSYTFRITDKSYLNVYRTDTNGNVTQLTLDSDYTVSGVGVNNGGTITLSTALANNFTLLIVGNYPYTQTAALSSQGGYSPSTHEGAWDKLTFIAQQLLRMLNRTFKFTESYSGSASTDIPAPSANKVLGWNSGGTGLANITPLATGTGNSDAVSNAALETRLERVALGSNVVSSHTVVEAHGGDLRPCANTSNITITVPAVGLGLLAGFRVDYFARTTNDVTFAAASGATLHSKDSNLTIDGQNTIVSLIYLGGNEWLLVGALK